MRAAGRRAVFVESCEASTPDGVDVRGGHDGLSNSSLLPLEKLPVSVALEAEYSGELVGTSAGRDAQYGMLGTTRA